MFFKTKLLPFITMLFQNGLRNQVLIVSRFCFTYFYLLFVLLSMVPFFCEAKGSFINLICKFIVFYTLFSAFILSFFLNFPWTKERIESLLGKRFLDEKIGLHYRGLIPFLFFLLTISALGQIDSFSMLFKVREKIHEREFYMNQVEKFVEQPLTYTSMGEILETLSQISNLPKDFSSAGIITEFSTWICSIF